MKEILIVDDDKDLSFIISEMLTDYGYGVTCAQSCDEAFFLLGERKFSLVLLDINLPDGTGFEICAQLRRASAVPVIIASVRTAEDESAPVGFIPRNTKLLSVTALFCATILL